MSHSQLIGFVFGIVITSVGLIISLIFIPKSLLDNSRVISICNIILAIGVLVSIYYSQVTLNNQRAQWLNDTFIKHEADVLLEFRMAYGEANEAIHFFLDRVLAPTKLDIQIKDAPEAISRTKLVKSFNAINKLNNLYNKNEYIFRKHNLEKSIACLTCLLDVEKLLPKGDLEFKLVEQDEKSKTYYLAEWNIIVTAFTVSAYCVFDADNVIKKFDRLKGKDFALEFDRMKGFVTKELLSLTFKLDKLTLYNDNVGQKNLNWRSEKFYQDL